MNRYAYRVKRMERRVNHPSACKECEGKNRLKVIIGDEPLPEPCKRCGREWSVVRIVRGVPPEGWEGRRMERGRQRADSP